MYKILTAGSFKDLERSVELALGEGWKLAGGVCFCQGWWLQAVGKPSAFA